MSGIIVLLEISVASSALLKYLVCLHQRYLLIVGNQYFFIELSVFVEMCVLISDKCAMIAVSSATFGCTLEISLSSSALSVYLRKSAYLHQMHLSICEVSVFSSAVCVHVEISMSSSTVSWCLLKINVSSSALSWRLRYQSVFISYSCVFVGNVFLHHLCLR